MRSLHLLTLNNNLEQSFPKSFKAQAHRYDNNSLLFIIISVCVLDNYCLGNELC